MIILLDFGCLPEKEMHKIFIFLTLKMSKLYLRLLLYSGKIWPLQW